MIVVMKPDKKTLVFHIKCLCKNIYGWLKKFKIIILWWSNLGCGGKLECSEVLLVAFADEKVDKMVCMSFSEIRIAWGPL